MSSDVPKTCFVVGPIGETNTSVRKLADWLLNGIFKPVLETKDFGYTVKRADDDADPGSITSAVINDVLNADLVIADLTGFNPNAFYELGIRHMVQKPTIHVIAEPVSLPFDNKDQRTIFVDIGDYNSVESARKRLRQAVQAIGSGGYQVSNPVTQAKAQFELKSSGDPKEQVIADLQDRIARLERDQTAIRPTLGSGMFGSGRSNRSSLLGLSSAALPSGLTKEQQDMLSGNVATLSSSGGVPEEYLRPLIDPRLLAVASGKTDLSGNLPKNEP